MRDKLRAFRVPIGVLILVAGLDAQSAREELARGHELWRQRLSKSALAAFESATGNATTAAEAYEAIGWIYLFKGWQQEGVFPGWHDEPEYRERAVSAFRYALAADPGRTGAAEGLKQAEAFAAAPGVVAPAAPRPEVAALDARIEAFRAMASIPTSEFDAAVEQRTKLQADPAPYFTAAQIMLERRDYARATHLAERGARAAEVFIAENEGAYKMSGKTAGARARGRAAALVILGAVALGRLDPAAAAEYLNEAERLTRGQDFTVQFYLGELANAQKDAGRARDHYLNALSLTGGPPPLRDRAMQAAHDLHAALEEPAGFDAWLAEEVERRRQARREAALRSPLDRPLPALSLTSPAGEPFDVAALRGKVLLLNFFSSW